MPGHLNLSGTKTAPSALQETTCEAEPAHAVVKVKQQHITCGASATQK